MVAMNFKKRLDRMILRQAEMSSLLESLELADRSQYGDMNLSTPVDLTNYTEDNAKTEFGVNTLTPFEILKKDDSLGNDQESVHSEDYQTKTWNGQVLSNLKW